ncbi:uncharacterized protein J8A68_004596 [[Candida] subhashii]|uniref:DNA helicase Pif1-like 2B domain-containing protein n=1 Tax=[Candida] subhashii TaxID=561895 RepID=A0A8J5UKD3_9ASCO|nr:uncharacterized protein J8A68_004596 [[Candida] subhashii]KAG7661876.1 hypothetical protein J8A68_004596 [[Candida] subhashii]
MRLGRSSEDVAYANWLSRMPKNERLKDLNDMLLERLPGECTVFESINEVDDGLNGATDNRNLPPEYLHALNNSSLPLATLKLKKNAPIMLLRNLDPANGLCNGTRMIITGLSRHVLEAQIISGRFQGEYRLIPRIKFINEDFGFVLCLGLQLTSPRGNL